MSEENPRVYTIEEVRSLLKLKSDRAVYKLINQKRLQAYKVGRNKFVTYAALENFLAASQQN